MFGGRCFSQLESQVHIPSRVGWWSGSFNFISSLHSLHCHSPFACATKNTHIHSPFAINSIFFSFVQWMSSLLVYFSFRSMSKTIPLTIPVRTIDAKEQWSVFFSSFGRRFINVSILIIQMYSQCIVKRMASILFTQENEWISSEKCVCLRVNNFVRQFCFWWKDLKIVSNGNARSSGLATD